MKKYYAYFDKDGNKAVDYHIRMKGISNKSILYKSLNENDLALNTKPKYRQKVKCRFSIFEGKTNNFHD